MTFYETASAISFLAVTSSPFALFWLWRNNWLIIPHLPKISFEWIGRLTRRDLSTGGLVFGLHLLAILSSPLANDLFWILPITGSLHLVFLWFLRNRADKEALKSARLKVKRSFADKFNKFLRGIK